MKIYQDKVIVAVDTGYGNIKTANHCFQTGITAYDSEPLFTRDMLIYDGKYYLIGEGHKEFLPEKQLDEDYFLLTLVAIAKELKTAGITEADVILAVGLPLTWMTGQKEEFRSYLLRDGDIYFTYRKVDYTIRICDVRVYPQGYAAIAPFASELK
ncbi:MAG: ParM/StbA family protein, partial [Clostridia bacterium]|nr:ParM/StbA family protein [Clostridia bacterium]